MAAWNNENEMFELMKEKLYTPVVGDILDQMGYKMKCLANQPIIPLITGYIKMVKFKTYYRSIHIMNMEM